MGLDSRRLTPINLDDWMDATRVNKYVISNQASVFEIGYFQKIF